jgi:hypothetical protein
VALTNPLFDEWGVIHDATRRLPNVAMKVAFLEALAGLEDHECHRTRKFPRTRLHKVVGYKQPVYVPISIRYPAGVFTCSTRADKST